MKRFLLVSFMLVFAFFTIGCASHSVKTDSTKATDEVAEEKEKESEKRSPSYYELYNPQAERR